MSSYGDGPRRDNRNGRLYSWGGILLGAILYIPALIIAAVGAVVGGITGMVAEKVKPGATQSWDAERILDK